MSCYSPGAAEAVEEVDPYELLDPVDILAQLPKDFYEKIVSKTLHLFFPTSFENLITMNLNQTKIL